MWEGGNEAAVNSNSGAGEKAMLYEMERCERRKNARVHTFIFDRMTKPTITLD
jgi:hypothetical protein